MWSSQILARGLLAAALAWCVYASPALAHGEGDVAVVAHNLAGTSSEGGADLELAYVGTQLSAWTRHARPYALGSINLNGETSYVAAGALWRVPISDRWTLEPGFGVALHNGALHNRYTPDDPRAVTYAERHQLLGARILFRTSLTLSRRLDNGASIGLVYEHLSNGGDLFGHSDNQSLNNLGIVLRRPLG